MHKQNGGSKQRCLRLIFSRGVFVIRDIAENIVYLTIENKAKCIQRFGTDILSVLHAMKRIGRKALLINQMIFCDAFFEKRVVEWLIGDHIHHPMPLYYT